MTSAYQKRPPYFEFGGIDFMKLRTERRARASHHRGDCHFICHNLFGPPIVIMIVAMMRWENKKEKKKAITAPFLSANQSLLSGCHRNVSCCYPGIFLLDMMLWSSGELSFLNHCFHD